MKHGDLEEETRNTGPRKALSNYCYMKATENLDPLQTLAQTK